VRGAWGRWLDQPPEETEPIAGRRALPGAELSGDLCIAGAPESFLVVQPGDLVAAGRVDVHRLLLLRCVLLFSHALVASP